MTRTTLTTLLIALTLGIALPATAFAADPPTDDDVRSDGTPKKAGKQDLDPVPKAPTPFVPDAELEQQAGIGGAISYGRAGVLELGGSLGVDANNQFTTVEASPSIGWFLTDNFQVSFIPSMTYINPEGSADLFAFEAVLEPSFHLPFTDQVFGFVGMGGGVSFIEDNGAGVALKPRIGTNIMVGRSGILTPALDYTLSTTEAIETSSGSLLAVNQSLGFNIGYTVMW